MDLSTDSQVDFIVSVGDHESGENEEMEPAAKQNQPNSDGTDGTTPPPSSAVNLVTERFRKRFGDNGGSRNQLLNEFWHRRQGSDEPVGTYIEEMASLARRMKLDNEPLMRQGIIQGLRPEIKRDVMVQKPSTLEALAEAAAIGEANARQQLRALRQTTPPSAHSWLRCARC